MSRALLSRRLRALEEAGVISKNPLSGKRGYQYELTAAGHEFKPVVEALGTWGQRWTVRVQRTNLDAGLLMWNIRRRIACERLPDRRVVTCFRFTGIPRTYRGPKIFWLVLERSGVELCVEDPGHEIDLDVEADVGTMARVWLGDLSFDAALRSGELKLTGAREIKHALPSWLLLSHFAGVARPHGLKMRTQRETAHAHATPNHDPLQGAG